MVRGRRLIDLALEDVSEAVGANLSFDEYRVATFECANDVVCTLEAPDDAARIFLHAPVLRVPGDAREKTFARAMSLNLFQLELAGAALAYDETSDELVLCHTTPAQDIDGDRLAATLAVFVEQVGALRRGLAPQGSDDALQEVASYLIRA